MTATGARALRACVVTATLWGTTGAEPGARQDPVRDALDRYRRGEHAAAVALPGGSLPIDRLLASAAAWIAEDDAPGRRLLAAAYVLEVVWVATRHADNAHSDPRDCTPATIASNQQVSSCRSIATAVAWACARMPRDGPPSPAEEWWWRASVGLLEDARAWGELLGVRPRGVSRPPVDPDLAREHAEGHLAHARSRLPAEPRWRLAAIAARASLETRWQRWSPNRRDVLRDDNLRSPGGGSRVERDLEALAIETPNLAGEVALHLGYRELQRRRWLPAVTHLQRAPSLADEPFLRAAAGYFGGYAFERLGRPADATEAYRGAHEHAPHVRNLATLLAAQLYLANQREEAHAILNASMQATPEPFDLRTQFERGSARLVPGYIERIREGLR